MRIHLAALALLLPLTACSDSDQTESAGADYPAPDQGVVSRAEARYAEFVETEATALMRGTRDFAAAVQAGRDDRARTLYPQVRVHWERIETIAESFGELDPKLDAREADLEPGQEWTGWHRLEKDLWPQRAEDYTPLSDAERTDLAERLVADTESLVQEIDGLDFTVTDIADGSKGLLEEVANGKVTGEEEFWSRTDLHDFQANVDGAVEGFEGVRPIVEDADPELAATLERRFGDVQELLDQHRRGRGFVGYDALSPEQVKALADAVNALSEPLSRLTAVVSA